MRVRVEYAGAWLHRVVEFVEVPRASPVFMQTSQRAGSSELRSAREAVIAGPDLPVVAVAEVSESSIRLSACLVVSWQN